MVAQRVYASGLRRDLELLQVLSEPTVAATGLGVRQVAERVGRDKAQVSRALSTMAEDGLVARDPETQAYRVGWRFYALAARTREAGLVALATPYLRRIVTGLRETTHLCVLRGGAVLTLHSELPDHAFRGLGWEGVSVRPHWTSAGRVLLSDWAPDTVRDWWRTHPPEPPTTSTPPALRGYAQPEPATTLSLETFQEHLAAIRRTGFAQVDEEFEPGLVGVSAPVRDFTGLIVAAINVAAPAERLGTHLTEAGHFTAGVAAELSRHLGSGPQL